MKWPWIWNRRQTAEKKITNIFLFIVDCWRLGVSSAKVLCGWFKSSNYTASDSLKCIIQNEGSQHSLEVFLGNSTSFVYRSQGVILHMWKKQFRAFCSSSNVSCESVSWGRWLQNEKENLCVFGGTLKTHQAVVKCGQTKSWGHLNF